MYYIGVDLGTSAVKLLLMEGSGKICNIVSKEYPLFFPHPGWSEQNPEDWFAQSMEGIKELTEGIDRKEVAGIGFGGQMHGLVTLDKDDNVIRRRFSGMTAVPVRRRNILIRLSERKNFLSIPQTLHLQASLHQRSSGCRSMSLRISKKW